MSPGAGAAAALAVCESLLIALEEKGMLSKSEVEELLTDAAMAHRHAQSEDVGAAQGEVHKDAADLIERIRDRRDSIHSAAEPR